MFELESFNCHCLVTIRIFVYINIIIIIIIIVITSSRSGIICKFNMATAIAASAADAFSNSILINDDLAARNKPLVLVIPLKHGLIRLVYNCGRAATHHRELVLGSAPPLIGPIGARGRRKVRGRLENGGASSIENNRSLPLSVDTAGASELLASIMAATALRVQIAVGVVLAYEAFVTTIGQPMSDTTTVPEEAQIVLAGHAIVVALVVVIELFGYHARRRRRRRRLRRGRRLLVATERHELVAFAQEKNGKHDQNDNEELNESGGHRRQLVVVQVIDLRHSGGGRGFVWRSCLI